MDLSGQSFNCLMATLFKPSSTRSFALTESFSTNFLIELEKRKLNYLGGLAKNRKVKVINSKELTEEIRLDT